MEETIKLPEDHTASYENGVLKIEGNGKEVEKKLEHAMIDVEVSDDEVVFSTPSSKRNITSIIGTFKAHINNMLEGLENDHVYTMKGVYAHFPMTVKKQGNEVHIQNFMGERKDRVIEIMDNVEVNIDGEDLEIRGPNKENVGQTAGRIEQACRKGNRDPRTFQDGIYITSKGDKQ